MTAAARGAFAFTLFRRNGVGVEAHPPRRALRAFAFAPLFVPEGEVGNASPFVPTGEDRRHG